MEFTTASFTTQLMATCNNTLNNNKHSYKYRSWLCKQLIVGNGVSIKDEFSLNQLYPFSRKKISKRRPIIKKL